MMVKGTYFRMAIWLLRRLQRILGASTVGVRALVVNKQQQILLVKHTYMPGWYLPGGGVAFGETPIDAVVREVREEAGIIVKQVPTLFQVYFHQVQGVNDYPILYVITEFTQVYAQCAEIAEVAWFDRYQLPADLGVSTAERLKEYFEHKPASAYWRDLEFAYGSEPFAGSEYSKL